MKTNMHHTVVSLDKDELKELLKETKETIATTHRKSNSGNHTFGPIDLWRMQKKHKTLGSSTRW